SRIPYAMAREGLFFKGLARLSARSSVPVRALLAQGTWATLLAISGTYDTLTDSVIFSSWLFYGLVAGALFVFRRPLRDSRPGDRGPGYPFAPAVFLLLP